MLSYAKAKRKLFSFSCLDAAIINIDDEFGLGISEELPSHIVSLSYSLKNSEADIYAYQTSYKASSIETLVKNKKIKSRTRIGIKKIQDLIICQIKEY